MIDGKHTIVLALVAMSLAHPAFAGPPAPRQAFDAALTALNANPGDVRLRGTVIDLARRLQPPPTVPPAAFKASGKGEYLMQQAKQPADFLGAAQAFGEAIAAAPWEPGAYYNQGVAYEKGQRADLAIASFEWYLKAAPDATDAADVMRRIGGLEVAASAEKRVREPYAELDALHAQLRATFHGKRMRTFACMMCGPKDGGRLQDLPTDKSYKAPAGLRWEWAGDVDFEVARHQGGDPRVTLSRRSSGSEGTLVLTLIARQATDGSFTWTQQYDGRQARGFGSKGPGQLEREVPAWMARAPGGDRWLWCSMYEWGLGTDADCGRLPAQAADPWAGASGGGPTIVTAVPLD